MSANGPYQRLSNPANNRQTMAAWDAFLRGQPPQANALRCLVDDSWRRCLAGQVDPSRGQALPPVPDTVLHDLRQQHRELVDAATQVMAQSRELLAESGTIMILSDPNGMILAAEGDPRALADADAIHLAAGSNWSERLCGTNAIGTALSVGQPVQIHAAEHFCSGIKQWTCAATVIRDPYDGKVLGALDVSGLGATFSPHSLALAVTTAGRIESQLARREMEFRYQLLERGMVRMASPTDGVIVCDRRGFPIKANERAGAALLARGIDFDWKNGKRIASLSCDSFAPASAPPAPRWLRADWLEPVLERGERIGTLLTIPALRRPERPARAAGVDGGDGAGRGAFAAIIGDSAVLQQAINKARLLAACAAPVLLQGETGVGKENFARAIHDAATAGGASRPFVALNCGGLSKDLLASELFGHCEGAFTGSRRGGMAGKVEAASGGTLFLDELGEMPLELQPHFLRVLEQGEIYRIGETTPRKIAFKLIAASNRDLRGAVAEGRFRMDLYYRVAVTSVRIPPLRERGADITRLAEHFLARHAAQGAHPLRAKTLAPETAAALLGYGWPGNVRELRNVIESMVLMARGECLGLADLPPEIALHDGDGHGASVSLGPLEQAELTLIRQALDSGRGNLTLVARQLGMAKSTLYAKLKKYGLAQAVDGSRGSRGSRGSGRIVSGVV